MKEEEEYNKVILGRVVEGCSNEKGYKKYSKEKDQRVRDLLEVRLNRTERLLDLDTGVFFLINTTKHFLNVVNSTLQPLPAVFGGEGEEERVGDCQRFRMEVRVFLVAPLLDSLRSLLLTEKRRATVF